MDDMNIRRLEDGARLLDSVSWSAIASGTIIALALEIVLLLFGVAIATSVGDGTPGAGYAVWMALVQLFSIAIGAALAARLSHVANRFEGMGVGVLTWALVVVIGVAFQGLTMTRMLAGSGAWAAF